MTLTRPIFDQINSANLVIEDPLIVLNKGSSNTDIGLLFNRAPSTEGNTAIYWSEADGSFAVAYTTSSGLVAGNVAVTAFADLTMANLVADNAEISGAIYDAKNLAFLLNPSQQSVLQDLALSAAVEQVQTLTTISSSQTIYPSSGSVINVTSNASTNWTINFAYSPTVSMNSYMKVGQAMTLAVLVPQGGTAYYNSSVQIDGVTVTTKWQGGAAPTSGTPLGTDLYVYLIIKLASASYAVFATVNNFALREVNNFA